MLLKGTGSSSLPPPSLEPYIGESPFPVAANELLSTFQHHLIDPRGSRFNAFLRILIVRLPGPEPSVNPPLIRMTEHVIDLDTAAVLVTPT